MMQFKINLIDFINYFVLFNLLFWDVNQVSAKSFDQNYNNKQIQDSAYFMNNNNPIKPIGGYGHPILTPRLTQEQIELSNPYLVNGNPELNQINCEGGNCHQPNHNIDQVYQPYNYYPPTATNNVNQKTYNNIFPYDDISGNSMIDRQHHEIEQQQSFKPNIENNLPTSLYPNNFFHLNQPSQNTFNQDPNQQIYGDGSQMENSNYKIVIPHVSNNNVDINLILEQQNEHLRVLLHNIKQQQLKLMQTIMDIQNYVENLPIKTRSWSEKQIENQQQNQINLDIQPVRGYDNIVTNINDNRYPNDLSKNRIQN